MQDPIAKLVGEWLSNVTIYSVIIRLFNNGWINGV